MVYAGSYQSHTFRAGGSAYPFGADALEEAARLKLPAESFDYIAGAAGRELTARANIAAFTRYGLIYRVLRHNSPTDPAVTLLGTPLALPVLLAPAGAADLAHPGAEAEAARGAADVGTSLVLSAVTSTPLEDVAAAAPHGHLWFQLAWPGDEQLARSLVHRAEKAGYAAVVLMGDCYAAGWRPRELDHGFFPYRHGHGLGNYSSDPRFWELADHSPSGPGLPDDATRAVAAATWNRVFTRPSLAPEDLATLKSWTHLPVLVKGVCDPGEARCLVDAGADGIAVSNHGGRQLDSGVAALDCLPAVAAAVSGRVPLLFDSGIRTGTDVLIALALGADAVMIGRPWLYGLALGGADGVAHVLRCLKDEFTSALTLTGHHTCATLSPSDLTPVRAP
ncbi:alpha-hydroxy-acid oxidizing protein [Streptomyces clavuligerus]|nr:alpha-hydroxy-acid oxidizing protein [Streptomyces clavuligerus]EDY47388.1 isopentenyl-diphosphate delta-isomerase II [Streptomyces clavuligerus]MBY6306548.1 alpha-hydroxy-acid oxidizing protein [Streptomyces clavuligerus]QCS10843.1 isopentenyl-diphosphate delta-isomerase [Streptomyces clavuligerus]QPJ97117.1 isopentenyl-diphosphate delta-isomerase [Streptomyces clavuligerus]WDN57547.1 alpha-hydroxy-acid oxidizing protein [Streptomyces clavuligerus]